MLEFHEKRRLKRYLYSRVTLVIMLLMILLLIRGVWGVFKKERETMGYRTQAAAELAAVQDREANLIRTTKDLSTPAGVEEQLRKKFGVVKEGERLVVIVDDTGASSSTTTKPRAKGFWAGVVRFFSSGY